MASVTKFYLRDAATWVGGTLPATNATVSATTPTVYGSTMANKALTGVTGSSQTSVAPAHNTGTSAQSMLICRWISDPLAAQTIASQTITFSGAFSESDAKSNFLPSFVVALWRPSNGTLVGRIYDQASNITEPGTGETAGSMTATSTAQTAQSGDVLVIEVWRKSNAAGSPGGAYTNSVYYDGTTEGSNTTCAAYLGFTTAVDTNTQTYTATANTTVSPTAAATPEAMTKSTTATGVTSSPTAAATPEPMVKSTVGQAVTVSLTAAADSFLFTTQRTTISGSDAKTYGTMTGHLGRAGAQTHSATAATTVSPTAAAAGVKTHTATADTTVSPTASATPAAMTKSATATGVTVGPTADATPAAMTKSTTATGVTVGPTTTAVPAAITDQATADATVSPTTSAVGTTAKASTATGVTVSPTTDATPAAMTKSTTGTGVTVSPSALADPAAIVDTATADTTVSPTASATPAAITKSQTATGVTVSPTTDAVPGASTKPAIATGVTVSPSADAVPAAITKETTAAGATVAVSTAAASQVWRQRWFKPDAIISMSGLSGSVSEIQDSPTSPDADALDPVGGAVTIRISFENHGQELRTNTGDQVIRVLASTP